jgi:hypothetical protein
VTTPGPADPFGPLAEGNAQVVAMWSGLVAAGMPPMVAAVYLGQWMGTVGAQNSKPEEKPPDGQ